jgi:hypothetical protein
MNDSVIKEFWKRRCEKRNYQWTSPEFKDITFQHVARYMDKGSKVLDLGAGDCEIASRLLKEMNCAVTAVDYVEHPFDGEFMIRDVRNFIPVEHYDVILMLGLAQYLDDDGLRQVYCNIRHFFSKLIIKHQCHIAKTTVIDKYSQELQSRYISMFRTIGHDLSLIKECFNTSATIFDLPMLNRHKDTKFKLFLILGR